MDHDVLFAPWRISYLREMVANANHPAARPAPACFLCDAARCDSAELQEKLVLLRDERGLIMLNRYPYTNGHILIAAADHLPSLGDHSPQQRANLMELAALAERAMHVACQPQGINIGINLGRAAGAGVPGHMHMHLVPRWNGDTNFMDVVGKVRIAPQALEESYALIKAAMEKVQS